MRSAVILQSSVTFLWESPTPASISREEDFLRQDTQPTMSCDSIGSVDFCWPYPLTSDPDLSIAVRAEPSQMA